MRAIARRAATIFQPSMLPERSRKKATSRGRVVAAGQRRPAARSSGRRCPRTAIGVGMKRQRRPHGVAPEPEPQDEIAVEPLAGPKSQIRRSARLFPDQTACRLTRRSATVPAGVVQVDRQREPHRVGEAGQQDRRRDPRGVGHGVRIDRSAITDRRPGRGTPGMYRGATTSGKRNVTSPSL